MTRGPRRFKIAHVLPEPPTPFMEAITITVVGLMPEWYITAALWIVGLSGAMSSCEIGLIEL